MRNKAQFALRLTTVAGPLPHAKEIKVQCGGLLGLRATVFPELAAASEVGNVHGLVRAAQERFDGLRDLPYQEIMKSVVTFEGRRRHGSRRS